METEILIIGSGCAGLYCALQFPQEYRITIITKEDAQSNDSFLAQGGMCMLRGEEDFEGFFEDTLRAGHYENDKTSVEIMIRSSQAVVEELISYGAAFARNADGTLAFTREGAHSKKRIIYHEDTTGREITNTLLSHVRARENITLLEYTTMLDIVADGERCYGAVLQREDGGLVLCKASQVVLATGGIGGLYTHSTNFPHLTGDALAVALRHGVALQDIGYVQIHPTTLYTKESRSFLISESVRGEGAVLRDKNGERFTNELLPRDLLTKEIYKQMEKDKTEFVWEDLRSIPREELLGHFPNIVQHCREQGYDVTKEWIPVVPAQHYFMGGVKVNHESRTSMERLYAVGETACNGVHGKNRLASNSLLESLVFAKRAAQDILCQDRKNAQYEEKQAAIFAAFEIQKYRDTKRWTEENRGLVREALSRSAAKEPQ